MRRYDQKLVYGLGLGGLSVLLAMAALGGVAVGSPGRHDVIAQRRPLPEPTYLYVVPTTDPPVTTPPPTTAPPQPEQPANKKPPQYVPPPRPKPVAHPPGAAKTPAQAVAAAVAAGRARGERVGVAVLDLHTGTFYGGGDVDGSFASASVMKVFIATRLLVDGQAHDSSISSQMWQMITASDDNAASNLYHVAGTASLIPWIASRYHISGLAPPPANQANYWGLTRITARAIVRFYAAVAGDPVVAPWLLNAMANARATAADGFHQYFGIPSAASTWRVKQGWMCCLENRTRMHSTGYVNSDRYAVALLTEGATSVYGNYGAQTLTSMARALMPGGSIPKPPPPPPPPTPSPSPTASPTPSPTTVPPPTSEPPSPSQSP